MIEFDNVEERQNGIADAVHQILRALGENPHRDGLKRTPERVAHALLEMTSGYGQSPKQILASTFEKGDYNEMVVVSGIELWSICEHHIMPFHGSATVGYIPDEDRIVGISKLARLTECFARRLQVQERLTSQIANAIWEHLKPKGVGVVIRAKHLCMCMRGVRKDADTITSYLLGVMRDDEKARAEFLSHATV